MGKRNKIRYKAEVKPKHILVISENIYLRYVDDEAIEAPQKGDLQVFPRNDALNSTRLGEYEGTGYSGYFKVDIYDGRNWQPVIITNIFTRQENHFSKKERPIDTYYICEEVLKNWQGKSLVRTYREHYVPDDEDDDDKEKAQDVEAS
jgi:hypothetical protein